MDTASSSTNCNSFLSNFVGFPMFNKNTKKDVQKGPLLLDSFLLRNRNRSLFDNIDSSWLSTCWDNLRLYLDENNQCIDNNDQWQDHKNNDNVSSSPSLTSEKDSCEGDNNNNVYESISLKAKKNELPITASTSKVPKYNYNCEQNMSNLTKNLTQEYNMKMKINIDVNTYFKKCVKKRSTVTLEMEETEKIDTFKDFLLKDDLEDVETKLKQNVSYHVSYVIQIVTFVTLIVNVKKWSGQMKSLISKLWKKSNKK
ncbi:uncharacterized protein LOC105833276 isoform X2 [Monomorium pharaonis]|uniref:uncharacterized protein LOC105833276 isoform X2 n=1 Tax=Monomorium pharaonis TaxID=307658 RepID=UPI00063F4319|nr:uncharacterized protein LOC105833276 isoform X2 [Monomorium pharaonis]